MAASKFKVSGIFALTIFGLLFVGSCFFIYSLASVVFFGGQIVARGTLPPFGAVMFILFFTSILIFIFRSWRLSAFNIKIDKNEETILFQNVITRQTTLYNFTDFDSYMDTYVNTPRGPSYKVIYLLNDKKTEKIISGLYYQNINELEDAISSIKYLGFQKDFSSIARKAFLNRPIIIN